MQVRMKLQACAACALHCQSLKTTDFRFYFGMSYAHYPLTCHCVYIHVYGYLPACYGRCRPRPCSHEAFSERSYAHCSTSKYVQPRTFDSIFGMSYAHYPLTYPALSRSPFHGVFFAERRLCSSRRCRAQARPKPGLLCIVPKAAVIESDHVPPIGVHRHYTRMQPFYAPLPCSIR